MTDGIVRNEVVTTTVALFNDHLDVWSQVPVDTRDPEPAIKAAPEGARTLVFYDHHAIVTVANGITCLQSLGLSNPSQMFIVH
ncbi:MAG: hypothetical protein ABIR37_02865 [Candidatus Saccharimonadales bacterium]